MVYCLKDYTATKSMQAIVLKLLLSLHTTSCRSAGDMEDKFHVFYLWTPN